MEAKRVSSSEGKTPKSELNFGDEPPICKWDYQTTQLETGLDENPGLMLTKMMTTSYATKL